MHQTRRAAATAAAILILPLASCATLVGGDLVRKGETPGKLIVINQSGAGIDVVTISRCNAMSYGLNRLPGGAVIGNGTSGSWSIGPGCWDVQAGRTGSCSATQCSWQEATQRMTVAPGQITEITFTYDQ
jgi:hypothetical protein